MSEVNGALGAPGVPFLVLLQSAFRVGRNGVRHLMRQQPAAKLLSHTRQAVRTKMAKVMVSFAESGYLVSAVQLDFRVGNLVDPSPICCVMV